MASVVFSALNEEEFNKLLLEKDFDCPEMDSQNLGEVFMIFSLNFVLPV